MKHIRTLIALPLIWATMLLAALAVCIGWLASVVEGPQ